MSNFLTLGLFHATSKAGKGGADNNTPANETANMSAASCSSSSGNNVHDTYFNKQCENQTDKIIGPDKRFTVGLLKYLAEFKYKGEWKEPQIRRYYCEDYK